MKKFFLFTVVFILNGCVTEPLVQPNNLYSDHYSGVSNDKKVFYAPVKSQHSDLAPGKILVQHEIGEQLKAAGWQVTTESEESYSRSYNSIVDSVGGMFDSVTGALDKKKFGQVQCLMASKIGKDDNYGIILVPNLVIKQAELHEKYAYWDGVKRRKPTKGHYANNTDWAGSTLGVSLEIMAFSPEGKWLFTSYGGLVIPAVIIDKGGNRISEVRKDMFSDQEEITSGVSVALQPITNPK